MALALIYRWFIYGIPGNVQWPSRLKNWATIIKRLCNKKVSLA